MVETFKMGSLSKKRHRIDDVAKLANRSRATVDRVLNGRPGVSAKTKLAVEDAIAQLGFSASALDQRRSRDPKSVLVFLSKGTNPFFPEIARGFENSVQELREEKVVLTFDGFDPYQPETLVRKLENVPEEIDSIITIGVDSVEVKEAIDALVDRGIRVVTIISDAPRSKRAAYVGQDNFTAGKAAGRLMCELIGAQPAKVAVLIGHLQFRHLLDRQSGFQQAVWQARPDITVVQTRPYGAGQSVAKEIVRDIAAEGVRGVYVCGGGQPAIVNALEALPEQIPVVIGHEITDSTRQALTNRTYKLVIAHDVVEIGRKALEICLYPDTSVSPDCSIDIVVTETLPAR